MPNESPMPIIGPIRGEMSMAPIITAVEFTLSPIDAIKTEQTRIHTLAPLNQMLFLIFSSAATVSISPFNDVSLLRKFLIRSQTFDFSMLISLQALSKLHAIFFSFCKS